MLTQPRLREVLTWVLSAAPTYELVRARQTRLFEREMKPCVKLLRGAFISRPTSRVWRTLTQPQTRAKVSDNYTLSCLQCF